MFFSKSVNIREISLLLVIEQSPFRNLELLGNLSKENPFLFTFHCTLSSARDLRTAAIVNGFRRGDFLDLACEKPETYLFTH
jgi:hypothetical protein